MAEAYLALTYAEEAEEISVWARSTIDQAGAKTALEAVHAINTAIFCGIDYRRREEAGVQSPATTLRLGTGSCRDMATLGMDACRSLGIPCR